MNGLLRLGMASVAVLLLTAGCGATGASAPGAPNGAVIRPGPLNPWASATGSAQALVLVHNNWINITSDSDGGLDDFSSKHAEGANILFGDGSVRFIRSITADDQDHHDFWAMGTRAGNEIINGLE